MIKRWMKSWMKRNLGESWEGPWAQESLCPCEVGVHHPPCGCTPEALQPRFGDFMAASSFNMMDHWLHFSPSPYLEGGEWTENSKLLIVTRSSEVTSPAPGAHPVTSFKQEDAPMSQEITRVSGALWQEPGSKTNIHISYYKSKCMASLIPHLWTPWPLQSPGTDTKSQVGKRNSEMTKHKFLQPGQSIKKLTLLKTS